MSTESLSRGDAEHFSWSTSLSTDDYVTATYLVETSVDPELCALAMAKEQSMASRCLHLTDKPPDMGAAARVVSVETLEGTAAPMLPQYRLATEVYPGSRGEPKFTRARLRIAYPIANLGGSLAHLWNFTLGELPRLGYLNAFRFSDLELPPALLAQFKGPKQGVAGLRRSTGIHDRPIFCRSTRPAVGLDIAAMCRINERVLRGGFDAVKDDELTADCARTPYAERVRRLAAITRRAEQETGERKLYFANAIDDPEHTQRQLGIAENAGVDGILVAPAIQGLSFVRWIGSQTSLPIMAHNTGEDMFTRHPRYGVSPAVYTKLLRLSGADLVFLPGDFGTVNSDRVELRRVIGACLDPFSDVAASWPVIAGGKRPEHLAAYRDEIGSPDFMIIAASAVDDHPAGLEAGARAFRDAWTAL